MTVCQDYPCAMSLTHVHMSFTLEALTESSCCMEKRRNPLEGFDWVFKPESVGPPPDMEDDSFERLFGRGPTMRDLEPIAEAEPMPEPEFSFLIRALREHPRMRRVTVRAGLAVGAIVTGVTAAFITHSPVAKTEALPTHTPAPQSSASSKHTNIPKLPDERKPRATTSSSDTNPVMTPMGFAYRTSASPTYIPDSILVTPTSDETVDATSRPPASDAPSASATCPPSMSPSETITETPSQVVTESPSESPTDVETTSAQTGTPQVSQSPSLGG